MEDTKFEPVVDSWQRRPFDPGLQIEPDDCDQMMNQTYQHFSHRCRFADRDIPTSKASAIFADINASDFINIPAETTADFDQVPVSSAGAIIYMVNPNNVPHVVLGREQFVSNWRSSLKWSDFCGRRDPGDADAIKTAAREFFEETIGIFGDIEDRLRAGEYNFQIVMKRTGHQTSRVMFVVQVPWNPDIERQFYGRREHLRQILFAVAEIRKLQCEINNSRLPVPDFPFRIQVKNESRFVLIIGINSLEELEDGKARINITCVRAHRRPAVYFSLPKTGQNFDVVNLETSSLHINSDTVIETAYIDVDPASLPRYARLMHMHERFYSLLSAFPREIAARALVWREYGQSMRSWIPYVRHEFLEKDRIRLWTVADLRDHIDHYRQNRTGHIRNSFLPMIKAFLQQLMCCSDSPDIFDVRDISTNNNVNIVDVVSTPT